MNPINIGEIARKTGLAVSAIRYYEECGLLPRAHRQANNRRSYGIETFEALEFISACRKNGMGLTAIRELQQKLSNQGPRCDDASAILQATITELSVKIAELQAARRHLSKVASECCADKCGPSSVECNIGINMKAKALA
jgi:MerR family transcriptional regulator, copper efflux regulator